MSDLRDLYQEVILDHGKNPRNFRSIESPTHKADGYNPLCGDRVSIYLLLQDDRVEDVAFQGAGCAICMASTSMMTQALKGKSLEETEAMFKGFHALLTEESTVGGDPDALGKLKVFAGVKDYPVRVKCATLPWHTLHAAIQQQDEPVTTE